MAIKIAISNQKGGVGKTTTTGTLGKILKEKEKNVLLIDLDPQGNLGLSIHADINQEVTMYDLLKDTKIKNLEKYKQETSSGDIYVSNIYLASLERELNGVGREYRLKEFLEKIEDNYDFILIDCPPSLGILTLNALTASDYALIPSTATILSVQGIKHLYDIIQEVKKYSNKNLKELGILITKFNSRANTNKEMLSAIEEVAEFLKIKLYNQKIRQSIKVSEAQSHGKNIVEFLRNNSVSEDYLKWVEELIQDIK